jgi:hypothetical protein
MLRATVVSTTSVIPCAAGTAWPTTTSANTTETSPRGPNQPTYRIVGGANPERSVAIAIGSIRTIVRLSTA